MMALAEQQAQAAGYQYMYLWTKEAADFYRHCGYAECQPVSLHRPCLKALDSLQLSTLEAMLSRQVQRSRVASGDSGETVASANGR